MEDPIVAEVHATREKMLAAFNYDLGAMMKAIRESKDELGRPIPLVLPERPASIDSPSFFTPPKIERIAS